jgi:phage shock protein A
MHTNHDGETQMFSLFRKTWIQITGALHDLVDKSSDAGRTARQGVRGLEDQIRQAEESVTDVGAELRLMQHENEKATDVAGKWGRIAAAAADAGNRAEAIEAIQQQVQAEEMAQSYGANVARLSPMLSQLKMRLSDLRLKKQEMQNKTSVLDARSKVAKAESRAARYLGNVGNAPGVDFDQLEKSVDREEAKAAALADMAHEKTSLDVNKRLSDFSRKDAIAEKMQALGLVTVATQQLPRDTGKGESDA